MADTIVDAEAFTALDHGHIGPWGWYWEDESIGVCIFNDALNDVAFRRTTDKGVGSSKTDINIDDIRAVAVVYDRERNGATGTLVHLLYLSNLDDNAYYRTVDVSDGSLGTERTIAGSNSVSSTADNNKTAIGLTVSGNIIVAFITSTVNKAFRSTDGGANWTAITSPFESATVSDWILFFAANTSDDDDLMALHGDVSASEWSIKMWDNSAGTWTETSIVGSITMEKEKSHADASLRHSDKMVLFATHRAFDTTTDDILAFELNPNSIASPGVTAKTDAVVNVAESGALGVHINQQNDDVRIISLRGGTWTATVDAVTYLSTDDMSSWASEAAYTEGSADDFRSVGSGRTVDNLGGRYQPIIFNDDTNDLVTNLPNDVEISAVAGGISMPLVMLQHHQLAGGVRADA